MFLISLISVVSLNIMSSKFEINMSNNSKSVTLANDINSNFLNINREVYKSLSVNGAAKNTILASIEKSEQIINNSIAEYNTLLKSDSVISNITEKDNFNKFTDLWSKYSTEIQKIKVFLKDNAASSLDNLKSIAIQTDELTIQINTIFTNIIDYRKFESGEGFKVSSQRKSIVIIVILFITLIIMTICTILSIYIGRSISRTLQMTTVYAKTIENGDLSGNDLIIKTKDELSTMVEAFNYMKNSLRGIVKRILETSVGIKIATGSLNDSIVQNFHTIEEINKAVEEIAAYSVEHSGEINKLSRNLGMLYSRINNILEDLKNISMKEEEKTKIINIFCAFRQNILDIYNSCKAIYGISEHFIANNEEISASLEEQVTKLKDMVTKSQSLLGSSEVLDKSMGAFILPKDIR